MCARHSIIIGVSLGDSSRVVQRLAHGPAAGPLASEPVMRAQVGDRLVLPGRTGRGGVVVGLLR
jgi:hypothetical protein